MASGTLSLLNAMNLLKLFWSLVSVPEENSLSAITWVTAFSDCASVSSRNTNPLRVVTYWEGRGVNGINRMVVLAVEMKRYWAVRWWGCG